MRKRSFDSVTVFEADTAAVDQVLGDYIRQLSQRKEVLKVWLIGSYHRKDFTPFSDVDVVIIVSSTNLRPIDRSMEYAPENSSVPVDVFVYTIEEVESMRNINHYFWLNIEKDHTVLFER